MRPPLGLTLSALLIPSSVLGFKDTSPLLIWCSAPNAALREAASDVSSGMVAAEEAYRTLSYMGCEWERIIVIQVDELHESHLQSLTLPATSADLHIPYLLRPRRQTFDSAIEEWAQNCGAELVDDFGAVQGGKAVMRLAGTKGDVKLPSSLPDADLIILTGSSSSPSIIKRQQPPLPSGTSIAPLQTTSAGSPLNTTAPTGGPLLDRVQLLTTPIITALLISFLLFVPIIGFGVSALVGIQVPPRMMEISKSMTVGKDRKDQ